MGAVSNDATQRKRKRKEAASGGRHGVGWADLQAGLLVILSPARARLAPGLLPGPSRPRSQIGLGNAGPEKRIKVSCGLQPKVSNWWRARPVLAGANRKVESGFLGCRSPGMASRSRPSGSDAISAPRVDAITLPSVCTCTEYLYIFMWWDFLLCCRSPARCRGFIAARHKRMMP